MLAARYGHLKVVTFLVTHGSQLEATSTAGLTSLMLAAREGHLEVVTYLVTHGSQLEATSKNGETALHYAAQFGQIDVTKWLTDKGCSPWKAQHRDSDQAVAAALANFLKALYFRRWKTWMLHILYMDASFYEVSASHMSNVLDLIFMVQ
ncbi:fibronectin type 3 and ankyrin repeat domains protein 1-like [Mytilus edulis]|uniref:fibronectin type 3 and ankyrin repeat domains protein 1-like n=1 Tax=Mytilus edulis TaxID=6550 RepID=UPI0039F09C00